MTMVTLHIPFVICLFRLGIERIFRMENQSDVFKTTSCVLLMQVWIEQISKWFVVFTAFASGDSPGTRNFVSQTISSWLSITRNSMSQV